MLDDICCPERFGFFLPQVIFTLQVEQTTIFGDSALAVFMVRSLTKKKNRFSDPQLICRCVSDQARRAALVCVGVFV